MGRWSKQRPGPARCRRAARKDACAPSKSSAKILLQHWGLRLLGVASLCRRAGSRLENVTVACARNQFRTIHTNLDAASLSRMRRVLRIVAEAVLSSQFFRDHLKSVTEILLLGIVEPGAGHPREII